MVKFPTNILYLYKKNWIYKSVTMEDTLKQNLKEPERNLYGITYKEDYVTPCNIYSYKYDRIHNPHKNISDRRLE